MIHSPFYVKLVDDDKLLPFCHAAVQSFGIQEDLDYAFSWGKTPYSEYWDTLSRSDIYCTLSDYDMTIIATNHPELMI